MKKLITGALIAFSIAAGIKATAQVHVNVNIGAPVAGTPWYNTDDDYYYLPEQGVYYNNTRKVYVYQDNNNWVYGSQLPGRYNGFNWQRSHYVKVRERSPFMHHDVYAGHYPNTYHGGHETYRREDHHDNHRDDRGHGRR